MNLRIVKSFIAQNEKHALFVGGGLIGIILVIIFTIIKTSPKKVTPLEINPTPSIEENLPTITLPPSPTDEILPTKKIAKTPTPTPAKNISPTHTSQSSATSTPAATSAPNPTNTPTTIPTSTPAAPTATPTATTVPTTAPSETPTPMIG